MKKKKILVIGSSNMDVVMEVDHIPVAGETILAKSITEVPGGKGANQAYAAARLGGRVTFLGAVGDDKNGKVMRDHLRQTGVDTSHMAEIPSMSSGGTMLLVNREGDNSIVVNQGANLKCDINYLSLQEKELADSRIVMVQMEIPYPTVYESLKRAKETGAITILDPAPAPDFLPEEVLRSIDYLTPNEGELCKLTGRNSTDIDSLKKGAEQFLEKGTKNVLVTMGSKGVLLVNKSGAKLFPAIEVRAVDTTAAGDTFNAAFAVGLSEGRDVEESILFAEKAAALTVCRKGAQASIPEREEADFFLG